MDKDKVVFEFTKKEFILLVSRYERSLEAAAARDTVIDEAEFELLQKLHGIKK